MLTMTESTVDRSLTYRWFAGLLAKEPDAGFAVLYGDPTGKAFLNQLAGEPELDQAAAVITGALAEIERNAGYPLDIAVSYSKLFHGAGGRRTAPPYQSAYGPDSDKLFQAPEGRMREYLGALNLSVAASFSEPVDHISIQLNVLAELVDRCGDPDAAQDPKALLSALESQGAFMDEHLLSWVPEFAERCRRFDEQGFVKGIVTALEGYLRLDRARLVHLERQLRAELI